MMGTRLRKIREKNGTSQVEISDNRTTYNSFISHLKKKRRENEYYVNIIRFSLSFQFYVRIIT